MLLLISIKGNNKNFVYFGFQRLPFSPSLEAESFNFVDNTTLNEGFGNQRGQFPWFENESNTNNNNIETCAVLGTTVEKEWFDRSCTQQNFALCKTSTLSCQILTQIPSNSPTISPTGNPSEKPTKK